MNGQVEGFSIDGGSRCSIINDTISNIQISGNNLKSYFPGITIITFVFISEFLFLPNFNNRGSLEKPMDDRKCLLKDFDDIDRNKREVSVHQMLLRIVSTTSRNLATYRMPSRHISFIKAKT